MEQAAGKGVGLDVGCSHVRAAVGAEARPSRKAVPAVVALGPEGILEVGKAAVRELDTRHENAVTHVAAALLDSLVFTHKRVTREVHIPPALPAALILSHLWPWVAENGGGGGRTALVCHAALTSLEARHLEAAAVAAGARPPFQRLPSPACIVRHWITGARVSSPQRVLCLDAGCRFTSVCLADAVPAMRAVNVRAIAGIRVGGHDVSERLATIAGTRAVGATPAPSPARVLEAADRAKISLQSLSACDMLVNDVMVTVTAADLEDASADFAEQLSGVVSSLLSADGSGMVTTAVLAGGSSLLPVVHRTLSALGLQVDLVDPEFAGSFGAAAIAAGCGTITFAPEAYQRGCWAVPSGDLFAAAPIALTGSVQLPADGPPDRRWALVESPSFPTGADRPPAPRRDAGPRPPWPGGLPPGLRSDVRVAEGRPGDHVMLDCGAIRVAKDREVPATDAASLRSTVQQEEARVRYWNELASCRNDLEEVTLRIDDDELDVVRFCAQADTLVSTARQWGDVGLPCRGDEDLAEHRRLHRILTMLADAAEKDVQPPAEALALASSFLEPPLVGGDSPVCTPLVTTADAASSQILTDGQAARTPTQGPAARAYGPMASTPTQGPNRQADSLATRSSDELLDEPRVTPSPPHSAVPFERIAANVREDRGRISRARWSCSRALRVCCTIS